MNATIGYVLVSHTHRVIWGVPCGAAHCFNFRLCPEPVRPYCHAACVHRADLLAQHPECQRWEAWQRAHRREEPTGGTRLGPLHYFSDCQTLLKRGPRREDARVVPLESGVAEALGLPLCKECQ